MPPRQPCVLRAEIVTGSLLMAIALMLIIEGILPFAAPSTWRDTFRRVTELKDGQIRFIGLTSILVGMLLLIAFR